MTDNKFSKSDMERVGLFQEMGYVTIGDKFTSSANMAFNQSASQGRQMLTNTTKAKSALQAGYFSERFDRVMEGEAYSDQVKMRRQHRAKEATKNIGKPFMPSSMDKKPSGLGSHYGTLSGPIEAFSPESRPAKEYKAPGKNFYTNPGKRGTGYGYAGITLGPYANYKSEDYDVYHEVVKKENEEHRKALKGGAFKLNMAPRSYFDENPYRLDRPLPPARSTEKKEVEVKPFKPSSPAKRDGGMKAGTFDPYPAHDVDQPRPKVRQSRDQASLRKSGKAFFPSPGPKSTPISSVLHLNVDRSLNVQNYKTVQSVMSY